MRSAGAITQLSNSGEWLTINFLKLVEILGRRRMRLADGGNTSQTRGERRHGRVNASLATDCFSKILGNHSVCFIDALFCTNIPEEMRTKSRLSCNFPKMSSQLIRGVAAPGAGGRGEGPPRSVVIVPQPSATGPGLCTRDVRRGRPHFSGGTAGSFCGCSWIFLVSYFFFPQNTLWTTVFGILCDLCQ